MSKENEKLGAYAKLFASNRNSLQGLEAAVLIAEEIVDIQSIEAEELLDHFYKEYSLSLAATVLPNSRLDVYRDPLTDAGLGFLKNIRARADRVSKRLIEILEQASKIVTNRFTNPTGGGIRPQDDWGSGEYEAPRDGGQRQHAGVDYLGNTGAAVYAGIGGALELIGDGVRITGRVNGVKYTVRQLHISPMVSAGPVDPGTQVATVTDLTGQYPGIQNHCHIEIYQQPGDVRLNPIGYFG